jgi:hypothetical protein
MPWVEFKPTIPASEQAKTVHALDRSATVTGTTKLYSIYTIYFHESIAQKSKWGHETDVRTSHMNGNTRNSDGFNNESPAAAVMPYQTNSNIILLRPGRVLHYDAQLPYSQPSLLTAGLLKSVVR